MAILAACKPVGAAVWPRHLAAIGIGASGIAAGEGPGGEDGEQVGAVIDRFGS
jgi:hypothetical protein